LLRKLRWRQGCAETDGVDKAAELQLSVYKITRLEVASPGRRGAEKGLCARKIDIDTSRRLRDGA
jgi:hypothetical protein